MIGPLALVAIRPGCGHKVFAIPEAWGSQESSVRELKRHEAMGLRVETLDVQAALALPWCPIGCAANQMALEGIA